ncbi:MAG: hypothetical protein Q4C96_11470 [Planctomycetia bacterium]|nr:hypothetical protein [Planctomycetia bacterium]
MKTEMSFDESNKFHSRCSTINFHFPDIFALPKMLAFRAAQNRTLKENPYTWTQIVLLFLIPSFIWLGFAILSQNNRYSLESIDTLFYIQNAENFASGNGFTHNPRRTHLTSDIWNTENHLVPTRLFPPGLGVLAAPLIRMGMSAYSAVFWTATLCSFFALWLILWFFRMNLPFPYAFAAAIPTVISLRIFSFYCQSEAPYLLFSTMALFAIYLAVQNAARENLCFPCFMIAGLAGGYAWTIRNAGMALFFAVFIYLLYFFIIRGKLRDGVKGVGLWLLGWLSGSGWLLIYNCWTFGTGIPYKMPPSTVGFWENCRWFLSGMWGQGVYYASMLYPNKIFLLLCGIFFLVLMFLLILCYFYWRQVSVALNRLFQTNTFTLLLILYGLGIGGVTILARTKYQWGEFINTRHHYPIDWIKCYLFFLLAWFLVDLLKINAGLRNKFLYAVVGICCLSPVYAFYTYANIYPRAFTAQEIVELQKYVSPDEVLLSNHPFHAVILGNLTCRSSGNISLSTLQEGMENGKFAGFIFTDENVFIREWENEESRKQFLLPLLAEPEKYTEFRRIELSPRATFFQYQNVSKSVK